MQLDNFRFAHHCLKYNILIGKLLNCIETAKKLMSILQSLNHSR
jgi:hypothetical protein